MRTFLFLLLLGSMVFWGFIPLEGAGSEGRVLTDLDRHPFLIGLADPEGFLYRGIRNPDGTRNGDQKELIERVKSSGGNAMVVLALRSHGDGDLTENPFVDSDVQGELDEDILHQWEEWFDDMEKAGITIVFFFYDDGISIRSELGWPMNLQGNLHPQERYFIETLVNRFEHHKNLVWVVMEETEEMSARQVPDFFVPLAVKIRGALEFCARFFGEHRGTSFFLGIAFLLILSYAIVVFLKRMERRYLGLIGFSFLILGGSSLILFAFLHVSWQEYVPHTKKIAETIGQTDDYKHGIGVHVLKPATFSRFEGDRNIDALFIQLQEGSNDSREYHRHAVGAVRAAKKGYAVVYGEIIPLIEVLQRGDRETLRKIHWAIAMAGAFHLTFGAWNPYYENSTPTQEMLGDMRRLQQFFESTTFDEMTPSDELASGGTEYVLANPGESYILYAWNLQGNMGLEGMSQGIYDLYWYDIPNGRFVSEEGVRMEGGTQSLEKPEHLGNELALYIIKR
ncbi:MAG: DUF2304 domain-containing protein [Patescibacteria group bacterium]